MERLRIIATAAALGEFTVPELAAFSGGNPNTIRSVLRREQWFAAVGTRQRLSTGRPTVVYRVTDPELVRAEILKLEEALGLARAAVSLPEETDDDRLAALVVDESKALDAARSDSAEERPLLIETARRCLRQSKADQGPRARRAELVGALLDAVEAAALPASGQAKPSGGRKAGA